jgi:hypothetical protein
VNDGRPAVVRRGEFCHGQAEACREQGMTGLVKREVGAGEVRGTVCWCRAAWVLGECPQACGDRVFPRFVGVRPLQELPGFRAPRHPVAQPVAGKPQPVKRVRRSRQPLQRPAALADHTDELLATIHPAAGHPQLLAVSTGQPSGRRDMRSWKVDRRCDVVAGAVPVCLRIADEDDGPRQPARCPDSIGKSRLTENSFQTE